MLPPIFTPTYGFLADYALFWFVFVTLAIFAVVHVRHVRRVGARPLRLVVSNVLVLATLASGAFVAGETWFRFVYDETDSYGLTLTNWAWFTTHGHENRWGLRDRPRAEQPERGTTRVAVLGDSFVWGYGIPERADRFSDVVEARLTSAGRPIELVNAAAVGWSTADEIAFLERAQPVLAFDRVLLGYCLNDTDDLLPDEERFDRMAMPRPTAWNPWQSFLLDFLWFRLRLTSDTRVDGYFDWVTRTYEEPEVWERQRARIAELAALCRREGLALDVVVFPLFNSWGEDYPFDAAHEKVGEAFRAEGARVLDLRDDYAGIPAGELVVNSYDAHPNERAHAIAADAVLRELADRW